MLETLEGGCHCGQWFRAEVDLDLLSSCSCSIWHPEGHLPWVTEPRAPSSCCRGKTRSRPTLILRTVVAQPFLSALLHARLLYPASDPHRISVNDGPLACTIIDAASLDSVGSLQRLPGRTAQRRRHRGDRPCAAAARTAQYAAGDPHRAPE